MRRRARRRQRTLRPAVGAPRLPAPEASRLDPLSARTAASPSALESPSPSPSPERDFLVEGCHSIERYERLDFLGGGTYGSVFLAKDKESGRRFALKKVKIPKAMERDGFPITALREVNILLDLRHPNIVRVREMVATDDRKHIFMVMEYVPHDLRDLMERMVGRFLLDEIKTLLRQLLEAIAYLHSRWYIHRDLKTSNILYKDGRLLLADFGSARKYSDPLSSYTQLVITQYYRPPELLLPARELPVGSSAPAVPYSTAVDMWSIGCIFAELVVGAPFFRGKNELDQLNTIFTTMGPPKSSPYAPMLGLTPSNGKLKERLLREGRKVGERFIHTEGLPLLRQLLEYSPEKRISAEEALRHPFFREAPPPKAAADMPVFEMDASRNPPHGAWVRRTLSLTGLILS